jgi:hypothetical protein
MNVQSLLDMGDNKIIIAILSQNIELGALTQQLPLYHQGVSEYVAVPIISRAAKPQKSMK